MREKGPEGRDAAFEEFEKGIRCESGTVPAAVSPLYVVRRTKPLGQDAERHESFREGAERTGISQKTCRYR